MALYGSKGRAIKRSPPPSTFGNSRCFIVYRYFYPRGSHEQHPSALIVAPISMLAVYSLWVASGNDVKQLSFFDISHSRGDRLPPWPVTDQYTCFLDA